MSESEVEVITPPNTLKSKVGVGGPGAVDLQTLERAEAVIAGMTDSYLEWVANDLQKISDAYDRLVEAPAGASREPLDKVFQISHDMKGQGGSFDYQLMTAIGTELCHMIEKIETVGDAELEAIRVCIESMKLVISQRLQGNGGKLGASMLAGIRKVSEKVIKAV